VGASEMTANLVKIKRLEEEGGSTINKTLFERNNFKNNKWRKN
jgi:hypothetical protein